MSDQDRVDKAIDKIIGAIAEPIAEAYNQGTAQVVAEWKQRLEFAVERLTDVHRRAEDAAEAAETEVRELREAVKTAAQTFRWYEEIYSKKGTVEGDAKARRNAVFAEQMERALSNTKDKSDFEKARNVFPAPEEAEAGGHNYPGTKDPDDFWTSDCSYGCGAWMGAYRSGAPEGIDPFGKCPNAPQTKDKTDG